MSPDHASAEKRPKAGFPRGANGRVREAAEAKSAGSTSPTVASFLGLQRTAGNAAVTNLLSAQSAGRTDPRDLAIQRQPEATANRPGEQWPFGPITQRKSKQHDLATFVHWIRVVEGAYGPDKQAVLQRLRRLYYSSYSGKAGADFDQAIERQAGAGGPPLDTQHVGEITLDGLYETDTIRTLTGEIVDPSHILAALDVETAGVTTKAGVAEAFYDTPWTGIVSWTGDLASWFFEWVQQVHKIERTPPPPETGPATEAGPVSEQGVGPANDANLFDSVGATKAAKADLLGDMDAEVLAARSVQRSTVESIKAEKREIRYANIARELTMPVSKILEQYYGIGMGRDKPTEAEGRFPAFVRSASPPIPHQAVTGATGTNGSIALTSDAEDAIYAAIRNTARLFIEQRTSDRSEPLKLYDGRVREIAKRFTRFLETGLKSGDAPWP